MPRFWRGVAAVVIAACWCGGGRADTKSLPVSDGAAPPAALPDTVSPAAPIDPVKDLTPANWPPEPSPPAAELPGHVPGHLNPTASAESGLFATVEYLLWRPRRNAFDYAINNPNNTLATGGQVESLNYDLRSGVRTGLGYRLADSAWDARIEYTYLRSSANQSTIANPQGVLYPTLTRPGLTDDVQQAQAKASLEYNVFDLELGRRCVIDDHLAVRLFGGLRFATIRQTLTAEYNGIDARASQVVNQSNFDGFGPILGGEAVWAGGRGFHLYARANGGLLTGQTRNPLTETNDAGATTYTNIDYTTRKVVPMAGVGFGGGWQYRQFSVRVGYEITNYFGLIEQPRFVNDVSQGKIVTQTADLSFEGLFAQFGFSF